MRQYWRNYLPILLQMNQMPNFCGPDWAQHLKSDFYQFGAYTGTSMKEVLGSLAMYKVPVRKAFGFDAFDGMPIDENEIEVCPKGWLGNEEGAALNAQKLLGCSSIEETALKVASSVKEVVPHVDVACIPGWFENSLTDDIVRKYDMRPALYIDIDVDFGKSAYEALDFCFRNDLVKPGTIIGYDDWGGTAGWRTNSDGESKAHKDICEKYNVLTDLELITTNEGEADGRPHTFCQKIFRVKQIGGAVIESEDEWLNEWMDDED